MSLHQFFHSYFKLLRLICDGCVHIEVRQQWSRVRYLLHRVDPSNQTQVGAGLAASASTC